MTVIKPELFNSRSFIYRKHQDAEFTEVSDGAQILSYSDENHAASSLVDLSVSARFGIRGPNAGEAIVTAGLPQPEKPNSLSVSDSGIMILRLGNNEYWCLALPQGSADLDSLQASVSGEGVYPVYCHDSHAWLAMAGDHQADILAKVCGVDLRTESFSSGEVAMTSVARVGAIICHHQFDGEKVFSILSDSASAGYLWDALLDAMTEFNGKPAGQNILMS